MQSLQCLFPSTGFLDVVCTFDSVTKSTIKLLFAKLAGLGYEAASPDEGWLGKGPYLRKS